jgi:hypothetical protein
MSTAEAVMLVGEVFQQPRTPAVKATNMKKNPTMNRAIIARAMSENGTNYIRFFVGKTLT